MKREQLTELLYQGLETEMGGTKVYETALRCAQNEELKEEPETKDHLNWELIEVTGKALKGDEAKALKDALPTGRGAGR